MREGGINEDVTIGEICRLKNILLYVFNIIDKSIQEKKY